MKKLVIDIGNSRVKTAVFAGKQITQVFTMDVNEMDKVLNLITTLDFSSSILSSVRDYPAEIRDHLSFVSTFIELNENTKIPLVNLYETPATLGKDRLSASCAGHTLFRDRNVLVINAGTCITYDIVTAKGEYQGGSISPGITMRLKALHTFTGRLPLLSPVSSVDIPGKNTDTSILSGAVLGAVEEVKGMINSYQHIYPELKVVLSGGDTVYFENQLKSGIFVVQNIVLLGLNEILDYNV